MQTHLRENMWFTSFGRDCLPQLACIFVTVDVLLAFKPHYSSQAFQSLYDVLYACTGYICANIHLMVQVNLCQKLFFLKNMGRTFCVQKLFWMSETISVHNMFSPGLSLEFSHIELVIQWTICRHIVG